MGGSHFGAPNLGTTRFSSVRYTGVILWMDEFLHHFGEKNAFGWGYFQGFFGQENGPFVQCALGVIFGNAFKEWGFACVMTRHAPEPMRVLY